MARCFIKYFKVLFSGAVLAVTASGAYAGVDRFALIHHAFATSPSKDFPTFNLKQWDYNWDKRKSLNADKNSRTLEKSKACRHIILIRHGQYHYFDDDAECHLTSLGRDQLDLTGRRLRQLNFPYSRIVYSTMTRAIESTDEIIKHLPGVPTVPCDLIREGAPFPPEPPVQNWPPEGQKAYEEDGPRIEAAFEKYIHRADPSQTEDSYEIFVCHANVIRYFVCRALQLPPEAWIRVSLDHGSLTWLIIRPSGTVSLRWLGNSGYMPPDKLSLS